MIAWLVVNSFMDKEKFVNLYDMLCLAFKKHDVELANNIMRSVQEEFTNKVYVTVQFK